MQKNTFTDEQLLGLIQKTPALLTDAERQLDRPQQLQAVRAKVNKMLAENAAKTAQAHAQAAQAAQQQGGAMQAGQAMQPQGQGQPRAVQASPRVPQGQPMQQQGYQMQQHMQQTGTPQQQQQQQHVQNILQKTQQLQQQAIHQQQMQQQQQYQQNQAPQALVTPSPQQQPHPATSSPMNNAQGMIGRSPNPNMAPARPNMAERAQMQNVVDMLPRLLELQRAGRLPPEQEQIIQVFLRTPEGQEQIRRLQAQHAAQVIQNNLQNPMRPTMPQQMQRPPMAQSQFTPMQQEQINQQAQNIVQGLQQPQNFAQTGMQANLAQTMANPQLNQALQQQLAMRQLNSNQAGNARPALQAGQMNSQQAQQAQQALAMAALVRQNQLVAQRAQAEQQQQMQRTQSQQGLQGQGAAQNNFGSPQAPQPGQIQPGQPAPVRPPPDRLSQARRLFSTLSTMTDAQRQAVIEKRPDLAQIYFSQLQQHQQAAALQQQAQAAQAQAQVQAQAQQSPHIPQPASMATPGGTLVRPPAPQLNLFQAMPNQSNVSANLHIPASKQRGLLAAQAGTGSPLRPPLTIPPGQQAAHAAQLAAQAQSAQAQAAALISQGIPVRPGFGTPGPRPQQDMRPQMMLENLGRRPSASGDAASQLQLQAQGRVGAPAHLRGSADGPIPQLDQSGSLLRQATWRPSTDTDVTLREKMNPAAPLRAGGPITLGRLNRALTEAVVEMVPAGLKAMVDEAEQGVEEDEEGGRKESGVATGEDRGLAGTKRRKVQELAESVDKGLVVDRNIETFVLQLADEGMDSILEAACQIAKHRNHGSVERKDVQLAYELTQRRTLPGFASDLIRADQARHLKRLAAPAPARQAKLKLINDAKARYKREKAARVAAVEEQKEKAADGVAVPSETQMVLA